MKALIKNSRNDGVIDADEFDMMRGVLSLDSKLVKEIMVPRVDAFMIDIHEDIHINIKRIIDESYSRIPIYENEKDNILGFVTIKDVLLNIDKLKQKEKNLIELKRSALVVLETSRVDDLLVRFKQSKQLMAVVIDEFSGLSGIVTLEDLIEEIVGEIDDEYDEVTKHYQALDERTYIVKGSLSLSDFNKAFETELYSNHYDTITGYMIEQLGVIPTKDDKVFIELDSLILTPEVIRNNRILSIKVKKK
ncbi:MAG: hemolysin family protein [Acholeplasma sp.]|nr:hemolysin family protein [Acholeplasma sp.]